MPSFKTVASVNLITKKFGNTRQAGATLYAETIVDY